MMQGAGNEKLCVPPGFRFHPTEEELVYYYLRKKISYEPIDLDVIKEVDLNKLEPWDLKEKCRIGSGPQNEWYLFSHKDKKYPTGTRTNRATQAGFWKATGRDKAIHLMTNSKRIGMRKTLVFYTGRAPRGHKTDWIMHEYRFDDAEMNAQLIQEDGWVICRVFKKKNHNSRGFRSEIDQEEEQIIPDLHATVGLEPKRSPKQAEYNNFYIFDQHSNSMHLPQLLSPESTLSPSLLSSLPLISTIDYTSQNNQIKLTSGGAGTSIGCGVTLQQNSKFSGDWSFLDKLLTTHHTMDQINRSCHQFTQISELIPQHHQRFSFSNNGYETDFSKFNN